MAGRSTRSSASEGGREGEKAASAAYRAPALEKGLDILELLSASAEPLTLSQIAQALGRSVQEVYRVILSLERRGYVTRQAPNDAFRLSMKLFDLGANHPPLKRLTEAARPIMKRVAERADQAVLLSIVDGGMIRVVEVAENPAPIGFRVRLGVQSPLLTTASGRTLLAFQPDNVRDGILNALPRADKPEAERHDRALRRIERIRARGYEVVSGETLRGITDISFPILDANGFALAAMTMPFLVWVQNKAGFQDAGGFLFEGARALTHEIGGQLPEPAFPLDEQEIAT